MEMEKGKQEINCRRLENVLVSSLNLSHDGNREAGTHNSLIYDIAVSPTYSPAAQCILLLFFYPY